MDGWEIGNWRKNQQKSTEWNGRTATLVMDQSMDGWMDVLLAQVQKETQQHQVHIDGWFIGSLVR